MCFIYNARINIGCGMNVVFEPPEDEPHFIFTVHLFITELFVPTNALRHFFSLFSLLLRCPTNHADRRKGGPTNT
jgi:hypothetical protein